MNIIFLDIDGVLVPLGFHEYLRGDAAALKTYHVIQDQRLAPVNAYDIAAVDLDQCPKTSRYIRQLVETCHASIVLTSSRRLHHSLETLKLLFSLYRLDGYLVDVTTDTGNKTEKVQVYLWGYPEIKRYAVIDSLDMEHSFKDHLIQVRDKYFNEDNLEGAICILRKGQVLSSY